MIPRATKAKLAKKLRFFFTCVALKCKYQHEWNAEFKTRYDSKMLSQSINIQMFQVRLDGSLHVLVPQINCRDPGSARVHVSFKYVCDTTQITRMT